jgi:hypothetical protein
MRHGNIKHFDIYRVRVMDLKGKSEPKPVKIESKEGNTIIPIYEKNKINLCIRIRVHRTTTIR